MKKTPKPPRKPAAPRPRPEKLVSTSSGALAPPYTPDTPSPREVRLRQWLWRADNPHER